MVGLVVIVLIVLPGLFVVAQKLFTGRIDPGIRSNDLAMGGAWLVAFAGSFALLLGLLVYLAMHIIPPLGKIPGYGLFAGLIAAYAAYRFAGWIVGNDEPPKT